MLIQYLQIIGKHLRIYTTTKETNKTDASAITI